MEPTTNTDVPPKPSIRPPAAKLALHHDYPTAQLCGIRFGLLSSREVGRLSVITEKDASNRRVGITRGVDLFDARLGVPNREQKCSTCNGTRRGACDRPDSCDGHFGHIALPVAIYHPHFIRKCLKTLSSICLGCSRVLEKKKRKNALESIFEEESSDEGEGSHSSGFARAALKRKMAARADKEATRKRKRAQKSKGSEFAKYFMQQLEQRPSKQEWEDSRPVDSNVELPRAPACKLEPTETDYSFFAGYVPEAPTPVAGLPTPLNAGAVESALCNYCGGPGGAGSKFPKVKLKLVSNVVQRKGKVDTIKLVVDENAGVLPTGFWNFVGGHPVGNNEKTRTLLAVEAKRILKRIPKEEIGKLNFDVNVARPDAFVVNEVLVSPNCNRLVMEDWSSTLQPRVLQKRSGPTNKLEALVRKAKQIKDTVMTTNDFSYAERDTEDLQLLTARHFRACKVVEYKITTGQEVEETGGTLELKWLKANVLAKRSNYTARSVINGDPCIRIEEIGIPKEIALRLTVDEKVTSLNIRKWQKVVDKYLESDNVSMPGAFILKKTKEAHQRDLELLRTTSKTLKVKLGLGDKISRCLQEGDHVFVNRPPSLHKHSLITLKVRVHSLSTIAINPLICPPFDADFDGDAFHIFVPQSLESRVETRELMTVPAQLISSQGGQPLIGLTQDTLVAGHLLTRDDVFIQRSDMEQLAMWCSSAIPDPAIVKAPSLTGPLWTGKQLFGMTLPKGLTFGSLSWTGTPLGATGLPKAILGAEGQVFIQDGELLICQGGSKWLDRSPNGMIRAICDHAGPDAAVHHLDCLQGALHQWLLIRGFSVGLLDFYAAEDPGARKRMRNGIQKSLNKSNEASLKQALRLDRQVQYRLLSPKKSEQRGLSGGPDHVEEHQGCFGLLLGEKRTTQRVAALQGLAIERFQTLYPDIENLVSGYMDSKNSLLAMVRSGSKGSMLKLTQQVGCLGIQLYKGERMLPVRHNNKLSYFQSTLEKSKSDIFSQTNADTGLEGYWESRGIIQSSYLDGLNVRELFMDSISSRCNVLRQGVEESNQVLKNLMLFMRDMKIEYDGSVRIGRGQNIIQFQYGTGKECPLASVPGGTAPSCGSSALSPLTEEPDDLWPQSKLAGEPVGVLAATSIAEPAYNVKMQSIHQAQVLGTSPVHLLKEVLFVRAKSNLKLNDRRAILRLPDGFGKERRALEIQRQLQKVTLEMMTLACSIEYWKLDNKLYVKIKAGNKDPLSSKPFMRMTPWMGHLQLCKKTMADNKFDAQSIVDLLNIKHSGKGMDDSHGIYFAYSDNCGSKVHPGRTGLCIWFFPVIPPESVATSNREVYPEKLAPLLESMKTTLLPAILHTAIRGSEQIDRVRIFWEDSGSASRLPQGVGLVGAGLHSMYQAKRPDRGELVVEVVVKAPTGAGKRGAAWMTVKEACISVMDMIDWRRSTPYAIQEITSGYGVEAAHHVIVKRIALASKNMGKPIHKEHMMLIADTMTHCGEVTGLSSAGYREFCRQLSISAPFTEASFQQPKKAFLDAAAGGAAESIDGVLASAVWGSRVPIGTGIAIQMKQKVPNMSSQKWVGDPLDILEELSEPREQSANQKASQFEKSLTAFQTAHKKDRILEMLEDLTGTTFFKDGELAGIMLGKVKSKIFRYESEEGCDEDMVTENVEDVTAEPATHNRPPGGQQGGNGPEGVAEGTVTVLQDGRQEGCHGAPGERVEEGQQAENGPERAAKTAATVVQDGKHEGCNRATGESVEDGMGASVPEGDKSSGCKRGLERSEEEGQVSDKPVSKIQKRCAMPSDADIAVLRVNDPRRIKWSGCANGVVAAEEQQVDCIYDSHRLPQVSSEQDLEENTAQRSVNGATASSILNSIDVSKSEMGGCDRSLAPSSRGIWTGSVTKLRTVFRSFFSGVPGRNDQDNNHEQDTEEPDGDSDLGRGDPDLMKGIARPQRHVLQQNTEQQKLFPPVQNGSSGGPIQAEVVADKDYRRLIIDEEKELQNLLHGRYRVGERVQGDVQKMILEEVLAHHPQRDEKIGCGVDYVKVDYHPDFPTSKCFHIVRKDGSWTDFSYHKCLDRKLLKLCNSKQK